MTQRMMFRVPKTPRASMPSKTQVIAPTLVFGVLTEDRPEFRIGVPPMDGTLHSVTIDYESSGSDSIVVEIWAESLGLKLSAGPGDSANSTERLSVKAGDKLRLLAKVPAGECVWFGAVFEATEPMWLKQETNNGNANPAIDQFRAGAANAIAGQTGQSLEAD